MKKLISMTDFVLEQYKNNYHVNTPIRILNYAYLLKQPLELWMFVPCKLVDSVWVVLEEPESLKGFYETDNEGMKQEAIFRKEYQQAKERCLFEGFKYKHIKTTHDNYYIINNKNITWLSWNNSKTIDDLLDYNQDLQLTQTAIKQIGL